VVYILGPPQDINSDIRKPCDLQKLINSLKLKKSCGIDGIPNECLRHLPRKPLVHLTQTKQQIKTTELKNYKHKKFLPI
jgi:hypothetical protein